MLSFIQARARFVSVVVRVYTADELAARLLLLGYPRSTSGRTARALAWALAYWLLPPDYVNLRSPSGYTPGKPTPDHTPAVKL